MPDTANLLRELGEPLVKEAFQDLLSSQITSKKAKTILRRFSRRWKDYSRAALMVISCQTVGGDPRLVHPAAKGLVLTGGAFDLHDDIIDNSYFRTVKRKKTILGIYGREATLLAGDALLIGGMSELFELRNLISPERFAEVLAVIKDGLFELGSAEMDEMALIKNLKATPKKYLRVVKMKAADVESYMRVGAIIGGGSKVEVDTLGKFGRMLGMITILRDDIEDTFNDKEELNSRILRESLPLPIVYALSDPDCRAKLSSEFESMNNDDLDGILPIIEKNRGFEKTKDVVEGYIKEAKNAALQLRDSKLLLSLFET